MGHRKKRQSQRSASELEQSGFRRHDQILAEHTKAKMQAEAHRIHEKVGTMQLKKERKK